MDEQVVKQCVSCGDYGHWYTECPKFDFWGAVWNAFQLGPKPWTHPSDDSASTNEEKP